MQKTKSHNITRTQAIIVPTIPIAFEFNVLPIAYVAVTLVGLVYTHLRSMPMWLLTKAVLGNT